MGLRRFTIIILGGISSLLNKNSTNKNDLILIIFEQSHEINERIHTLVSKNYSLKPDKKFMISIILAHKT
jgi:hypothetical protein